MMEDHIYTLGHRTYKLHSQDPQLLDLLNRLLPKTDELPPTTDKLETIDLDKPLSIPGLDQTIFAKDDPAAALLTVINRALADHSGYLWIDASALITPQEKLVLVSGPSHSGKTTLTLAMCLAHNWKVLAEDIVLINIKNGLIAPFARPLSLRSDTAAKIAEATGKNPGTFHLDGWLSDKNWYFRKTMPSSFDLAIDLSVTNKDSQEELNLQPIESNEFLRQLITHSNTLRHRDGIDRLTKSFAQTTCYLMSKGQPRERIEALLKLSGC